MALLITPRGLGDRDHCGDDDDACRDREQLTPGQGSRLTPYTPGRSHMYEGRPFKAVLKRTAKGGFREAMVAEALAASGRAHY